MGKTCETCIDVTKLGCDPIISDNVIYSGPNLSCSNINTKDNITLSLQKIDGALCTILQGQDLQETLVNGNISTDISALFKTAGNPNLLTTLSFDGLKTEDDTKYISYTKEGIFFSLNGTTIKPASSGIGSVNLLVPTLASGTYTIATVDQIPIDNDLLHKNSTPETKTGNLTVNAIIKAGGLATEFLKADGSVDTNTYLTSSSGVTTVFGRTGPAILAVNGDYTTALVPDTTNKRYVTDANLVTVGNQSGVNTGDETTASIQTKRPIKTINSNSLEGVGNILLDSTSIPNTSTVLGESITAALNYLLNTKVNNIDIVYLDVKRFGAIGDGIVDDYTAIQMAIDYCIINKKGLVFTNGTYRTSAVLTVTSSLNIKGEGSPIFHADDGVSIFTILADNVIISQINTKSNYVDDVPHITIFGSNCIINSSNFIGQGFSALYIETSAINTTILNSFIDNFEFGIYGKSTIGLKIINNTFTGGFDKEGETLGRVGDGIKLSTLQNDIIYGNNWTIITGNRFTDLYRDGIDVFTGGQNLIISNNIFERLGVLGLDIKTIYRDDFTLGTSVPVIRQDRKMIISNNIFKDTGYNNLVSGYSWISIIGTDLTAGQTHGIPDNPDHIIIESNLFEDATIYGILLDRVSNIDIKNNRIKGMINTSHHSIFLQGQCINLNIDSNSFYDLNNAALRSALTTHSNIRFTNNSVKGLVSNAQTTVFIGGSNIDISGNDIQYGNNLIFSALLTNSNVSNNKLRNAIGMGIDVRTNSTNVVVNNNIIYDSVTGIRGSATMINCTVTNNSCFNVTTPYLNFNTFTSGNIYGNTIENIRSFDIYGSSKLVDAPPTSAGTYDILTRNTSTGVVEKVLSSIFAPNILTGYVSGAGTLDAADNVLQAIQKLNGNDLLKANSASPTFTGTPLAPTATAGTNNTQIATTAFVNNVANASVVLTSTTAATLTLAIVTNTLVNYYVFTGTTTTWTLPVPAGFTAKKLALINTGSGTATVNTNAGATVIYNGGLPLVATYPLLSGSNVELISDGSRWIVL